MIPEFTFIRTKRKTIGITVKRDGSVEVRAPFMCSRRRAEAFVEEKAAWIEKTQAKMAARRAELEAAVMAGRATNGTSISGNQLGAGSIFFTEAEIAGLKKQAKAVIPKMAAELAAEMGVHYSRISIRAQKTRWGSCSTSGTISFNCMLMLVPENLRRYVVVHELCHIRHMNHSQAFWREVERYHPTYREDRKALRAQGALLLDRIK